MTKRYDPNIHHRRSVRLPGYDYAANGAYFVTICAAERACLFGEVVSGEMRVNEVGQIVVEEWLQTQIIRPEIELDAFVIMPNHIHGILMIEGRGTPSACPYEYPTPRRFGQSIPGSLQAIIGQFKSIVTKRINALRGTPGLPVWQRNYYEHIIRNNADLDRIREYIINNPLRWQLDQLYPDNPSKW